MDTSNFMFKLHNSNYDLCESVVSYISHLTSPFCKVTSSNTTRIRSLGLKQNTDCLVKNNKIKEPYICHYIEIWRKIQKIKTIV